MVISMLTIGALALVSFVIVEWKFAKLPMMPGRSTVSSAPVSFARQTTSTNLAETVPIFKNKVVVVLLTQSFLFGAVYQSYLYYVPLYLQNAHQYSVIQSAAIYVALVVCQSVFSIISGQYISRVQRYGEVIWAGFGLWTLYVETMALHSL